MEDTVIYKIIPNFPKYRVGNDGSIWSYRYVRGGRGQYAWKRLKCKTHQGNSSKPYLRVRLCNFPARMYRLVFVHVLVLETFVGPCPIGMEACHWDDNGFNNKVSNLRWDTRKANIADSWRNKPVRKKPPIESYNLRRGERHSRTGLTDEKILVIRQLAKEGHRHWQIAKRFLINRSHVTAIVNRRVWTHL